ncbi:hypothetical protein WME90_21500 [Sorangium sp. So ce375]|uniref:hypothetical protein n=1 Tax=Sorangium sp. So ce375 TaxID=3133306 RepID=UPI003F5B0109
MSVHHTMSMLLPVLALACSTAQGAAPEPPESTPPQHEDAAAPAGSTGAKSFVDAESYFTSSAEIDAWYGLLRELNDDFDVVCGDTFCEGDFSNYKPLRLRCSVEEHAGTIGRCVWVLAASSEEIVPSTGDVEVDARTFLCEMPVAPETAVTDLVEALSAPPGRAIDAALPGTDRSLYDGLVECL